LRHASVIDPRFSYRAEDVVATLETAYAILTLADAQTRLAASRR